METVSESRRLTFYVKTGCAYLALWLLLELPNFPGAPVARSVNNAWLDLYIIAVNYLFFGHAIPFLSSRSKSLFATALTSTAGILTLLFLHSFGLYAWRGLGIDLHLYTALKQFTSLTRGALNLSQHGIASVIFFGSVKHVYDHLALKKTLKAIQLQPGATTSMDSYQPDHLFITIQKKKVKIVLSEILYIESQREYIKIVSMKGELTAKMGTKEVEALLPGHLFRRIHRSFIISASKVESYTADTVILAGRTIPIGRGYKGAAAKMWN